MSEGKGNGKFFLGAICGAIAGAIAGVVLAPKSGKETREDIKAAGDKAFGKKWADLAEKLKNSFVATFWNDERGYRQLGSVETSLHRIGFRNGAASVGR